MQFNTKIQHYFFDYVHEGNQFYLFFSISEKKAKGLANLEIMLLFYLTSIAEIWFNGLKID